MIPKTIHQMWIAPDKSERWLKVPPDVAERSAAWQSLHPSFGYTMWTLGDVLSLCDSRGLEAEKAAILACRLPAMQADLGRLVLLKEVGGFWCDLKLEPKIAFLGPLADNDLVLIEHFPNEVLPKPNGFLINSFIGSFPGHPVIVGGLKRAVSNVADRKQASPFYVTGPTNLLDALNAHGNRAGVRVLPHEETYGVTFNIAGASYNDEGMHWSVRWQREPLYADQEVATVPDGAAALPEP